MGDMTRFCAVCGALLEATAWYAGRCPTCGAKVEIPDGASLPSGLDSAEVATHVSADSDTDTHEAAETPAVSADTTPAWQQEGPRVTGDGGLRVARRSRRAPLWGLALVAAVVIALVGVSAYALAPRGAVSNILAPFIAPSGSAPTASGASSGATVPAAPAQTASAGTAGTPTVSAAPSGTATVSSQPTATSAPAVLSVSPQSVKILACVLGAQTSLTVANTGGEPLTWNASNDGGYTLSAASGTLDAGASTQVTVSNILKSGNVTFSARGAQGSPQAVTITCTVQGG